MKRIKRAARLPIVLSLFATIVPAGVSSAESPTQSAGVAPAIRSLYSIDAGDADVRLVSEELTATGVIAVHWLVDGEPVGFASSGPVDVEVVRESSEKSIATKVLLHKRENTEDRHRSKAEELQMVIDVVT